MRKVIEKQLKIGQVPIEKIEIDMSCRDEIPQLLLGLQTIYSNKQTRDQVFTILEKLIPDDVNSENGRLGMELWKILVLGTLRVNCSWDYDKLHDIANNHKSVRQLLGHSHFEINQRYALQTLKDNIGLFTPKILEEIDQVLINTGHDLFHEGNDIQLNGRCDSFVVETDVHYPTDINFGFSLKKWTRLKANY
jgi:hypothetical protein